MIPEIDALSTNPRLPGVKALKGKKGLLRLRVGDYRVIYQVEEESQTCCHLAWRHENESFAHVNLEVKIEYLSFAKGLLTYKIVAELFENQISALIELYKNEFWSSARTRQDVVKMLAASDTIIGLVDESERLVAFQAKLMYNTMYKQLKESG
jgi:hypothetical protein